MKSPSAEIVGTRTGMRGFTLVELLVVIAIIGVLSIIALPAYNSTVLKIRNTRAVSDVHTLEKIVSAYAMDKYALPIQLPDALRDTGQVNVFDPWGHNYVYERLEGTDLSTAHVWAGVPTNLDYDLYSKGADGDTDRQLSSDVCSDDIVRLTNRPEGEVIGIVVPDIRPF